MRLGMLVLVLLAVAGCGTGEEAEDGQTRTAVEKRPTRPASALPNRPPSSVPDGAYVHAGSGRDPRIDRSKSGFSPEQQEGRLAGPPDHGRLELVQRTGERLALELTGETRVEQEGAPLGIEALREGRQVRASYYFDGKSRLVDRIEIIPEPERR